MAFCNWNFRVSLDSKQNPQVHFRRLGDFGRSVIIGFQKTQIYQWFAGSRQEGFILKIQNDENNAAQQDMRELVAVKGSVDHLRGLTDNQRNKEQAR